MLLHCQKEQMLLTVKYLRDCSLVFSKTLHEVQDKIQNTNVSGQYSKKRVTSGILKKILNRGLTTPRLGFFENGRTGGAK